MGGATSRSSSPSYGCQQWGADWSRVVIWERVERDGCFETARAAFSHVPPLPRPHNAHRLEATAALYEMSSVPRLAAMEG